MRTRIFFAALCVATAAFAQQTITKPGTTAAYAQGVQGVTNGIPIPISGSISTSGAGDTVSASAPTTFGANSVCTGSLLLAGEQGAGFQLQAGTLAGSLTPQYSMEASGTNWTNTTFASGSTPLVVTNPNALSQLGIVLPSGARRVQVCTTAYTSGTANGLAVASFVQAGSSGGGSVTQGTSPWVVSGTVTTSPPSNASTNVAQLAGTTTDTNSGTKSAGTLRVVLATDQPALTNKLLVTPDSVALPANQSVNVSQINAVTPLMGNGTTGTGSPRVTVASDNTPFTVNAAESGTWTVQPGNTANTTPWLVSEAAATSGGTTPFSAISAASTNSTSVKGSAGQLYGWYFVNLTATPKFLKIYDSASAPTCGSGTPKLRLPIPANGTTGAGAATVSSMGSAFASGIGFCLTGGGTDADTAATAVGDVYLNLFYK